MSPIDPIPTIRRIETDTKSVCAIEIIGHLTAADVENAYGLIEATALLNPEFDVLIRVSDYDGFDWSAVFKEEDASLTEARQARKLAFVGGSGLMRAMMGAFGTFSATESRAFDAENEVEAWEWIGARALPQD